MNRYNPYISVDCVIFGFDSNGLKVLLINCDPGKTSNLRRKLPGSLIIIKERLVTAAERVLLELTGLKDIYLKEFGIFDDPSRLTNSGDYEWLLKNYKTEVERVITVGYYSLININESRSTSLSREYKAKWFPVEEIPEIAFDHNEIIEGGLQVLRRELLVEPHCFELLPSKFTLNQLQRVYEDILKLQIDNRNFRKKVISLDYIKPLNEWQKGVSHKPARLFTFDKDEFYKIRSKKPGLVI